MPEEPKEPEHQTPLSSVLQLQSLSSVQVLPREVDGEQLPQPPSWQLICGAHWVLSVQGEPTTMHW
jgi:hypothetical protein